MNNFTFENKTVVHFGHGCVRENLPALLGAYGKSVMLAYGGGSIKRNGVYDEVKSILEAAGKTVVDFAGIMPNPTYAKVQEGATLARENDVDLILAVGGGSVSDCCKAVSAQAKLEGDLWEFENVEHGAPTDFIPLVTIVTVFGTGSEMNAGGVITNEDLKVKGPLWGAQADVAFLDPDYTMSVPFGQVISGAFDTLSHAMETYFDTCAQNLSDDINLALMRSVVRNIRVLLADQQNYEARSELAWASAMAENGILKIGKLTGFECHMMEHQLGAYTNCNHGAGLAVIHPHLYRHIYQGAPERFARFAHEVWDIEEANDEAAALAGIDALAAFIKEIGLPTTFAELSIPTTRICAPSRTQRPSSPASPSSSTPMRSTRSSSSAARAK